MSQTTAILAMLRTHPEGITAFDALNWAGSFRLAARISDLRAQGHDIVTVLEPRTKNARIARYRLREKTA